MVTCTICRNEIEESEAERKLIQARVKQGWGSIGVDCTACGLSFTYDVDPDAKALGLCCPRGGCTGRVFASSGLNDERYQWLCGECGNGWVDDDELQAATTSIVARFPHRQMVYQQYKGRWFPIPLDLQPPEYTELVERETQGGPGRGKDRLFCALSLVNDSDVAPELQQRMAEVVEELRGAAVSNVQLVDEQTIWHGKLLRTAFGIQLEMLPTGGEREHLRATEAVLESVRQLSAHTGTEFTVEFNGEEQGTISRGKVDENLELGLLQPWREGLV